MFAMRHSGAGAPNPQVREEPAEDGEGNLAWLERVGMGQGVILLGGSSLTDVRLRFAQSRLRADLTPSHWSVAGLLDGSEVTTVALDAIGDPHTFAAVNGVMRLPSERFDDTAAYPNVAVLLFTPTFDPIMTAVDDVATSRVILDVPALTVAWLSAVWAVVDVEAPLREGRGIPGAALVELSHAVAGLELTPGLESTASCPEAIWQAARWWTEYYRESTAVALRAGAVPTAGHAQPSVPAGAYVIRSRLVQAVEGSPKEVRYR